MAPYTKTLTPPDPALSLTTPDGLRYWRYDPGPTIGCQASVLTEDASIYLGVYGGMGRDGYQSFLFGYQGTRIGFMNSEVRDGYPVPNDPNPADEDPQNNTGYWRIRFLGTPVYDVSVLYERGPDGRLMRDDRQAYRLKPAGTPRNPYVTGLSWADYDAGKRDKFPSQQVQDQMLALLPWLFNGYLGDLRALQPEWSKFHDNGQPIKKIRMRLDEAVLADLQAGRYIA